MMMVLISTMRVYEPSLLVSVKLKHVLERREW